MVKIALQIKGTLENVQELRTSGRRFRWYLKFSCCNCGEVSEKWNDVSLDECIPVQKRNATNHFVSKCKLCARENSMTILEDTIKPLVAADQEKLQTVVVFDCRGLEPCDFSPREGWIAKAVDGGKEFTDVDLTEGEWADYCDKIKQPVGIYEIEHRSISYSGLGNGDSFPSCLEQYKFDVVYYETFYYEDFYRKRVKMRAFPESA